jgi:hypothetical protein
MDISHRVSSSLRLDISAGYCQRALVGDSGMIIIQMGKHNRSVIVAVYGTFVHCHPVIVTVRENVQMIQLPIVQM